MTMITTRRVLLVLFLSTTLTASQVHAQREDPAILSLERIFTSEEFVAEPLGPTRWLDKGAVYSAVEPSANNKDASEIVEYDPGSGRRTVVVSALQLIPPGTSEKLSLDDYAWSSDGRRLLIYTNSQRVWRQKTRGDYWVLDRESKRLSKLGGDAKPATLMFAQFSPDGTRVAYVRENNLYVEGVEDHRITQLTRDGSRTTINGTFDWVYEEELDLRNGFRWSPDGKNIAYWQINSEGVKDYYLVNNTDSLYPVITPVPYPKAGQMNSAARIGIVGVEGGSPRWMSVPGDPRENYIASMDWAESPDELVIQHLNRLQNTNEVMLADVHTGNVRTILTEKDKTWVDLRSEDFVWLDEGRSFTWTSERDGWRHVYVVSRDGKSIKLVTPGEFDVINVEAVDEKGGWLYYAASPENATQRYLYRTRLDGAGHSERLSPSTQAGTHTYRFSPDAHWAFHSYSTFVAPPETELIQVPGHKGVRELTEKPTMRASVSQLKRGPFEFFRVSAGGGVRLDGWIMKPPGFDPKRGYPVLFYVYGEPANQTVVDRWGSKTYLWHLMLTQQGYIVISIDNRGTPSPRGREWRKVVYRRIGVLASQEQAAAVREISRWPFVDRSRIGIWGWSGGGSMSLNMIFRYPEIYRMAMAVAPVTDMHYYDTIYQERYMGLPQDNEEGYKKGSSINFAEQLRGKLLIVHGTGDDNVHYQNTEALINKLIELNKPFTMMPYPNRTHSIKEGTNTSRHLFELLTRYLRENLPPGPTNQRSQMRH